MKERYIKFQLEGGNFLKRPWTPELMAQLDALINTGDYAWLKLEEDWYLQSDKIVTWRVLEKQEGQKV
jgi:hypothetical protein